MTTPQPIPEFQDLVDRVFLRRTPVTSAIREYAGSVPFNAMGKLVLEYEAMSDPGEAVYDMGGMTPGRDDEAMYRTEGTPLPFVSQECERTKDGVRVATGEVADRVERMTLGVDEPYCYGDGKYAAVLYGLLNNPCRITLKPHSKNVELEVDRMVNRARSEDFYGPFILVCSRKLYDEKVEALVRKLLEPEKEEEDRVILAVVPSAHLDERPDCPLLLVQVTPEVVRAIDGMPPVLTERDGKTVVATVTAVQNRSDYYGNLGVVVCPVG